MEKKILIIDDDSSNIKSIKRMLMDGDYQFYETTNPKKGLKILKNEEPVLILLDLRMPEMDGIEFLQKINPTMESDYSVIVLTGMGSNEDIKKCYNLGARAFLQHPINVVELKSLVRNTMALEENKREVKLFRKKLKKLVKQRTEKLEKEVKERKKFEKELKNSNKNLQDLMAATVNVLASVVELRDPYTAGHQNNVSDLAVHIAKELDLGKDRIVGIRIAGNMHDIGKINGKSSQRCMRLRY